MLRLFKRTAPPRDPVQFNVSHAGDSYTIALKRVAGATRFTIRVRSATRDVVLTMPVRGSLTAARDFAERHAAWIGARMRRLPQPVPFEPDEFIPFEGVPHRVLHQPLARGTVWVGMTPDSKPAICVAGDARHVQRRVSDFLKRAARKRRRLVGIYWSWTRRIICAGVPLIQAWNIRSSKRLRRRFRVCFCSRPRPSSSDQKATLLV